MGGGIQKQQFPQTKNYVILDYGYCKVWKRADTNRETMEQYEILIENERMLEAYKRMWLLRAQEEAVVGVYYFSHRVNKDICGFYQNGSILTERIPYRLSQFCNIPYEEMLLILSQTLSSFKFLYTLYGLFLVHSTMIGINFQKQIKVWHHTDLSSAQPENPNCSTLAEMVESIIQSVELNAEIPFYYPKFSDFMRVNRNKITPTFDQVLNALHSYMHINKIPKRESLTEISNFLRQAQGWEELTFNSNFLNNLSNVTQLNKSPSQKYTFRGNSEEASESSSKRTLRNTPANIYTHRQVKQERDRSIDVKSVSRSHRSPNQYQRYQYSKPMQSQQGSLMRVGSFQSTIRPIGINVPKRDNTPSPFKPFSVNSIEKNLHRRNPTQPNSIYYHQDLDYQPPREKSQQKIKFTHLRNQSHTPSKHFPN